MRDSGSAYQPGNIGLPDRGVCARALLNSNGRQQERRTFQKRIYLIMQKRAGGTNGKERQSAFGSRQSAKAMAKVSEADGHSSGAHFWSWFDKGRRWEGFEDLMEGNTMNALCVR